MQCPHCRSDVRALLSTPDDCPHCGRPLKDAAGLELREIDKDFEGLRARLEQQTIQRIKTGTIVCLVLSVVAIVPVIHPILATLITIQTWIWARPLVCAPYARHFSPSRRMVTRWLSRFLVFSLAGLHGHVLIPGLHFFAPVTSGIVFLATCGTAWAYHRFHLQREHDRTPILLIEKVLLVVAAVVALVVFLTLLALVVFLMLGLKAVQGQ